MLVRGRFVLAFALLSACNAPAFVTALHDLHQSKDPIVVPTVKNDFYALPYPNDLHEGADGTVDLSTYPRPPGIVTDYVNAFDSGIRGAGLNSAVYFRFDGAIDPATLPQDANASVDPASTAFLVDVTPGSPTYGMRRPLIAHYVAQSYDFIGPFWVALLPVPGFPLREKTVYAAVLTDGVKAPGGAHIRRARDLDLALASNAAGSSDPRIAAAAHAYAPLTAWLATQSGLAGHVLNATVFTTLDATSVMAKLRAAVYADAPAPVLADLKSDGEDQAGVDQIYEGTYQAPIFQSGTSPYTTSGGQIIWNADGTPKLDHLETLRVAISVPEGPMPAAGWPVILYAHGTGGDYKTFISNGSAAEAAKVTAKDGSVIAQLATISIDQVLNGARVPPGTNVDLAFFNLQNLVGARDNPKQGALDDFQLLRLAKSIDVAMAPTTNLPIRFDPDRIYFKGHSQGGLTGPLFLAYEPEVKAAVLSGAGGNIILALLNKTEPVDIPTVVGALLNDPVDQYHPLLNLAQAYFDESDPVNYARLFFREPPTGQAPKAIFQSLGLIDHYTPVPVIKALALAMGVQPVEPMLDPIDDLALAGGTWAQAPVSGNVAGGKSTGVLLEYNQAGSSDGHFVDFEVPAAIAQNNRFLATCAATGVAHLDPP